MDLSCLGRTIYARQFLGAKPPIGGSVGVRAIQMIQLGYRLYVFYAYACFLYTLLKLNMLSPPSNTFLAIFFTTIIIKLESLQVLHYCLSD